MLTFIEHKTPDYEIEFSYDDIKVKFMKSGKCYTSISYRYADDLEDLKDILTTEQDFKEQAKKLLDWIDNMSD